MNDAPTTHAKIIGIQPETPRLKGAPQKGTTSSVRGERMVPQSPRTPRRSVSNNAKPSTPRTRKNKILNLQDNSASEGEIEIYQRSPKDEGEIEIYQKSPKKKPLCSVPHSPMRKPFRPPPTLSGSQTSEDGKKQMESPPQLPHSQRAPSQSPRRMVKSTVKMARSVPSATLAPGTPQRSRTPARKMKDRTSAPERDRPISQSPRRKVKPESAEGHHQRRSRSSPRRRLMLPVHKGPPEPGHSDDKSTASVISRAFPQAPDLEETRNQLELREDQLSKLCRQGYPIGLARELKATKATYPLRFWVVDNSESMGASDGKNAMAMMSCTRFSELQGSVKYHARLAGILEATTIFQLLNDPSTKETFIPQEFSVAGTQSGVSIEDDVTNAYNILRQCSPKGDTPLTAHVRNVTGRIKKAAGVLLSNNQKAVIVLATDGLPTDDNGNTTRRARNEFTQALKALKDLPVWIVIRICTDDAKIVKFYNNLDAVLDLPLEVIDDLAGEAREIHAANPWLNYTNALHRCREMGYHHRIFDLLDERLLTKDELFGFLHVLFGKQAMANVPHPEHDWAGFAKALGEVVHAEGKQYNPFTRTDMPWIDMAALEKSYQKRDKRRFLFSLMRSNSDKF